MLSPKVAIVTGAGRGIGRAVALELASMGYALGICARTAAELEEVRLAIGELRPGLPVHLSSVDVCDSVAVYRFCRQISSSLGPISVLVNNAGMYRQGGLEKVEELPVLLETNVTSAAHFCAAVVPGMEERSSGYIINIASICGVTGIPEVINYCTSKYALVGFSESLYEQVAVKGIKVTALCPSWVATTLTSGAPVPQDEMMTPGDIALTVRYLLSLSKAAGVPRLVLDCIGH